MERIFILGPGRSGTTFLVKLFTRLNFNTGYTPYKEENYSEETRAGCETVLSWNPEDSDSVNREAFDTIGLEVMKAPAFSFNLEPIIRRKLLDVKHIFIPVRSLDVIAKSRVDTGLYWEGSPESLASQRDYSALATGFSIDLCITHNLPFTIMKFPDFVKSPIYCYDMLSRGVYLNKYKFYEVFEKTAEPENIKFKQISIVNK